MLQKAKLSELAETFGFRRCKKGFVMKERLFIQRAKEHVELEGYLRRAFGGAKIGQIEITYTPLGTRVVVHTITPGLVIGAGGETIREVSEYIRTHYKIENPQLDVQKIQNPDIDPWIVSKDLAEGIERGLPVKRLGNHYLERIMRGGAIGSEIVITGKLSGDRARVQRFIAGYLKKCGQPAIEDVATGFALACPRLGNVGVTVKIMIRHSDKKIHVEKPEPTPSTEEGISENITDIPQNIEENETKVEVE